MSPVTLALISFALGALIGFGVCLYMAPHRKALRFRKRMQKMAARSLAKGQPVTAPLDYATKGKGTLSEDYRLHDDYSKRKPARN